ncbi:MAG: aminoacyl-tRNA hydrolase [bacterium]|nr:aminoacyl-tRNA hydrolase [bacterium]MCY4194435.1 aminoacyl-tRNA hydrolase [bacterium]MCY4273098.1 aminoacyl-tRNA hydrolase [bacterium]
MPVRWRSPKKHTGTPADLVVVGLGNPGDEFAGSRHNVGAEALEVLAARHGQSLGKSREAALVAEIRVDGRRVVLALPQTFMNKSGEAVRALVRRWSIVEHLDRLVVIHDELDLPPGRIKVKHGGGLAGHNGLRSIKAHLHTAEFTRIRIGVGKPPDPKAGADYVLKRPGRADRELLADAVERAADAASALLEAPVDAVMNSFN